MVGTNCHGNKKNSDLYELTGGETVSGSLA